MNRKFCISTISIHKCLFSRRNGYVGTRILGYSIRLRLFGRDVISVTLSINAVVRHELLTFYILLCTVKLLKNELGKN
jgi:hypothetical protein